MTDLSVRYIIDIHINLLGFLYSSPSNSYCVPTLLISTDRRGYRSYPSSGITGVARKVSLFKEDAKRYGAINSSRSNACMRAFRFRLVGLLQHSLACFINALCCSELRRPVGQRYAISLCCFCSRYCFWTWHGFLPAHLLFGQHRGHFASLFGIESILSAHH